MTAYLDRLNPEQRLAVEHGVAAADARPLLVIAGAGSGKTDTLAHRVAHLIVNGADPRRMLLLTFSRRAAAEMARRAERIVAYALAGQRPFALPWSGTFHAIGVFLSACTAWFTHARRHVAPGAALRPDWTLPRSSCWVWREDCGRGHAPLQSRTDSEVISPTAMAGGNTGLVLCPVGGHYSGQ